jgi:hypothetical protein
MTELYTPEQLNEAAAFHQSMIGKRTLDYAAHDVLAAMLRQAADTEARVVQLVEMVDFIERAYREGFRDGSVDCLADERGLGGVGEDAYWSGSNAREALSKFRGEDA